MGNVFVSMFSQFKRNILDMEIQNANFPVYRHHCYQEVAYVHPICDYTHSMHRGDICKR